MPKGFGPKPPRSSAMPNTVIYRVLQCQKVLAPNLTEVPQCQTLLFTGFCNAKRFLAPNLPKFTMPNTVVYRFHRD